MVLLATYFYLHYQTTRVVDETRELFKQSESTAGEFTYVDINGNPVNLDDYLGKVIVVMAWASWSPYSNTDLSMLNALSGELRDRGVVFIALNRKDTLALAQRYLATVPPLPELLVVIDTEDRFYQTVGGYAMPETVLFNQRGEIIQHWRGQVDSDTLRTHINSVLQP